MADAVARNRGWETIKVGHEEAEFTRNVYNDELEYVTFQPAFEEMVDSSNGELSMTIGTERYPDESMNEYGKSSAVIAGLK